MSPRTESWFTGSVLEQMQTAAYKHPNLITSTFSAKHSQLMAARVKALSPLIFHPSSSHLAQGDMEARCGGVFL